MASKVSGIVEQINISGTNNAIASTAYGYCETAAAEPAKVVDMTDFKLYEGVTIHVKFKENNSAANPTLNVQDTGAKPIVQYGTTAAGKTNETNGWYAGAVITLTYDGTSWVRDQGFNSNNTYTAFTGKPTGNQTPGFGDTVTIQQISQSTAGQVSGTDRTITIPNTSANASTTGLVDTSAQEFAGIKTFRNGIEIKGHIAGDSSTTTGHGLYNGGMYHNAYNNIILHGDASTGSSGIAFVSDKINASTGAVTNVNAPSDRAFIQYHACGVTTAAAEGNSPTLATSGEAGRLVIGIGNDSGDKIILQAPGTSDIIHQMGANGYPIPHTTNTNGTVGGTTTPVYVEAGVIKAGTALGGAAYKAENYYALSDHNHDTLYIKNSDELLTTNPFAPASLRGPYISKIDNAFYAADKRWQVTTTNLSSGGAGILFDGSYETQARISGTDAAVITMDFDPEHANVTEKNKYFPGYPYGYILISFYNVAGPASISGRVYCNYNAHGIGWHNLTFSPISDNTAGSIVYRSEHQYYYNISVLEITINGDTSNSYGYTGITQIEMHLDRPNSKLTPFLSKYSDETLYYNLTAPKFIGTLQGNADTATKFSSTRKIELTGAVTGSATTDGSSGWTISTTVNHNHDSRYKIASGVITLGSNTITPITSIADLTGNTITAANLRTNLGLSAALRFIGKATTDITESTTTAPTVTGITNYAPEVGDVVLDKNSDAEYVCIAKTTANNTTTYTWELLGRSGSWATSTHTHGNITNGGLLGAANMAVVTDGSKKITTADLSVSDPTAATTTSTTFIDTISQNAQGKITATKKTLPTLTNVTQSSNSEDKEFPIILKNTNNSTNETNGVKYNEEVTVNPNKSRITATTIQANSRLVASKAISQIVTGTGTAGSYTNSTYYPAKWTFDTGLTATDGDIFTIKIPIAGHDYGVFMSVDNGSHYYPVVLNGTGRITTHYPVNTYITVIFEPTGSAASMFALAGQTSSTRITVTGGVWRVLNYYDSNSNDTGYYHRRIYPNLKAGGAIHPYSIIMQLPNGKWSGITTTAPNNPGKSNVSPVATGKTASTSGYMLGHVLLMYANTTYADTNNIGTYNIWSAHTGLIDARYSFNLANSTGNGFVAYTPVYIVGTVSDGLFHLDTTKWWTQTLPSSDDGKVYIYIGDAYDWYRLTFTEDKPIYWYKDGAVRLYSGASEYALNAATVNGLTVKTAVPANAIFTDHYDWDDITNKPTTLSGYGITDAASSGHSHTLKIGNKSLSVSTSEQEWTVHDIMMSSTSVLNGASWDITDVGIYRVGGSSMSGEQNPGSSAGENLPYAYGHLIVTRAGDYGAAQFYISDYASASEASSRGIRYRSGWNVAKASRENGASPWKTWATILDDKNFNLYAPTLTGTGASGSWGISITGSSALCTGNAATATAIQTAGTTAQFYRGDNSWSNIIKQTANAALGIDTNLKIGTAIKDLHFSVGSGSGTGINDGNAGGITIGTDTASYGGIYWQSSGSYGLRLHFATTSSFANGAYTRMLITHDGKVGIGTLNPDTLLTVNGNAHIAKIKIGNGTTDAQQHTITVTDNDLIFDAPSSKGFIFQQNATTKIRIVGYTCYPEASTGSSLGITGNRWETAYLTTSLLVGANSTGVDYNTNGLISFIGPGVISSCIVTENTSGYYLIGSGVQYGRWFIEHFGRNGDGTNYGDEGKAVLEVGNETPCVKTLNEGAHNGRGVIRIHGANRYHTDIVAQANNNRTCYLPYYGGPMYLVHAGNNNAIGNGKKPVYVAGNGRVTVCDTDVGDPYIPMYAKAGEFTVTSPVQYKSFTIASGQTSVTLESSAYNQNLGIDVFVLAIVITSGEEYLNAPITWSTQQKANSTTIGQVILSTSIATSNDVTGYILTAHGSEAPSDSSE